MEVLCCTKNDVGKTLILQKVLRSGPDIKTSQGSRLNRSTDSRFNGLSLVARSGGSKADQWVSRLGDCTIKRLCKGVRGSLQAALYFRGSRS